MTAQMQLAEKPFHMLLLLPMLLFLPMLLLLPMLYDVKRSFEVGTSGGSRIGIQNCQWNVLKAGNLKQITRRSDFSVVVELNI